MPPEAGFTLLEMLVAVTLVAMMAVGLWLVLRTSIRSWSRGTEFIDANQRHRSILDMARKQMASAYPLFTPIDGQQPFTPVDAQQQGASYLIFNGTENSLHFVSLNSLQFQESPGLTLVSYEVAQDSQGDYALVEKEARYTGQLPDEVAPASFSKTTPIFEKLTSCTFEYFDPGDSSNPSRWVREWEGRQQGRLPVAISMTMVSQDPRGNALSRHMVVPLQTEVNLLRAGAIYPFGGRRPVVR